MFVVNYHLHKTRLTCYSTCASYFTHYRIELPENVPLETLLVSLTCIDKDGTVPNNNITYHLIMDAFANGTFTLTNNELKVSISKLFSDCGPVSNLRFKRIIIIKFLINCSSSNS